MKVTNMILLVYILKKKYNSYKINVSIFYHCQLTNIKSLMSCSMFVVLKLKWIIMSLIESKTHQLLLYYIDV